MALTIAQSALALSADGSSATSFGPGPSITIGSGGNRALFFTFFGTVATASISSTPAPTITATFNGASVTMFGYRYHGGDRGWLAHGYLPAPPSGAGTLSVTVSSGQLSMLAFVEELTDAHQTTTPVVLSGGTTSASPPATLSGTTTVNNSYLYSAVGGARRSGAPSTAITCTDGTLSQEGITGTTDLQTVAGAIGYKVKATAGADSITFTWTGSFRTVRQSVEVFEEIASGGGITGTASGSADVTGAATGTVAIQGAASGTAGVTGAATGKVAIVGTASGSADVTGASTGIVGASVFGTASGDAGVTGSATGKVRIAGTASGQAGVTGAATGKVFIKGVATGQAGVTGSATGSALSAITGTATGEAGVTGTATGVIGAVSLRRHAYAYESANGGAFGPSRTGGTFAATANGGKLQG